MKTEASSLFAEPVIWPKKSKSVDPKAYKIVSVRLREGEYASLCERVEALGMTNSMALRIAARRITGFLEVDASTREALQGISDRIGDISDSIRQLSVDARRKPGFDMASFASQRAAFGAEFIALDRLLRTVLNVSRRRTDGCALLSQAAE